MFRGVIYKGTHFHSAAQCPIWPAVRVSQCREFISGASGLGVSGSNQCALVLANLNFLHLYRVLLVGVVNIQQ